AVNSAGCAVRDLDTSSCAAARQAAGLSGFWLHFSCRLPLQKTASAVRLTTDSLPDYRSNYFATTHPCWESYTGAVQNPNHIAAQTVTIDFPLAPDLAAQGMAGGTVGVAANGVGIFDNAAAPGDDIYKEVQTFDRCG